MYHWYLLLRKNFKQASRFTEDNLIDDDSSGRDPVLKGSNTKLFWIGFCEMLPIIGGLLLTDYLTPLLFYFDYAVAGIIVSIGIAYLFRKDVSDQPINVHRSDEHLGFTGN